MIKTPRKTSITLYSLLQMMVVSSVLFFLFSCKSNTNKSSNDNKTETKSEIITTSNNPSDTVITAIGKLILPKPYASQSVRNRTSLVDWPEGKLPLATFFPTAFIKPFESIIKPPISSKSFLGSIILALIKYFSFINFFYKKFLNKPFLRLHQVQLVLLLNSY